MAENNLIYNVKVNTKPAQEKLDSLADDAKEAGKKSGAGFGKGFEENLGNITKKAAIGFTAISATIGATVVAFAKFDNQLRSVKTLLNETSFGAQGLDAGFKQLQEDALQLAKTTPSSISEVNKALFDTVSAGVDASEAVKVVGVSSKLATAGLTDVSTATDGMTSALNAYGLGAEQADAVASKFFTAQKLGKTTIAELSQSFGLVGSNAAAAGVSIDELFAATSALTLSGLKASSANAALKAAIAGISKPTADAQKEAERLGVQFDFNALKTKGLEGVLNDLRNANGFTEESVTKLFGSTEAQAAIFALTGKQANSFTNALGELRNETTAVATLNGAFATQNASLSNQFAIFTNKLQTLAIQIGSKLAPIVATLLEGFNKVLDIVTGLDSTFAGFAASVLLTGLKITGFIGIMGGGLLTFGKFKKAIQLATVAIKGMGTAGKAAVAATGIGILLIIASEIFVNWNTIWPKIQAVFQTFVDNIKEIGGGLGKFFIGLATANIDLIKQGWSQLTGAVTEVVSSAFTDEEANEIRKKAASNLGDKLGEAMGDGFKKGGETINQNATEELTKLRTTIDFFGKNFMLRAKEVGAFVEGSLSKGAARGFEAFGAALVNGENALAAFGKAMLGVFGDILIQLGTQTLVVGLLMEAVPILFGLQGAAAVAAGIGMIVAGGALKALAGAGGGGGGGAVASGGGAVGSPTSTEVPPFEEGFAALAEEEERQVSTGVTVNVQGNVLDSKETGLAIAEVINDAFGSEGIVVRA